MKKSSSQGNKQNKYKMINNPNKDIKKNEELVANNLNNRKLSIKKEKRFAKKFIKRRKRGVKQIDIEKKKKDALIIKILHAAKEVNGIPLIITDSTDKDISNCSKGNKIPEDYIKNYFNTAKDIFSIGHFIADLAIGTNYVNRNFNGKNIKTWGNKSHFLFVKMEYVDSNDTIFNKYLNEIKKKSKFFFYFISYYEFDKIGNKKGYVTYIYIYFYKPYNPSTKLFYSWLLLDKSTSECDKIITGNYANNKVIKIVYYWRPNIVVPGWDKEEYINLLSKMIANKKGNVLTEIISENK